MTVTGPRALIMYFSYTCIKHPIDAIPLCFYGR
jgi:hypothetical protein